MSRPLLPLSYEPRPTAYPGSQRLATGDGALAAGHELVDGETHILGNLSE